MPAQLTPADRAYLSELAADIAAHGGIEDGQSLEQAMTEAHARRQSFAMEMAAGQTERAKKARRALTAQIYADAIVRSTLDAIEREDDAAWRQQLACQMRSGLPATW